VTMEVSDGVNVAVQVFNVMIRSINDPPIVIIDNLYQDQIIIGLFRIKGSADDFEKDLRNVEVAITERGDILYADNWIEADGAYVWQYMVDIRNYGEGWHTIYIRGFDGRDFSEVKAFDIFFDPPKPPLPPPPPVVTIDTQLNGLQSENVLVIGTVSDQSGHVSFVEYRIDGSIWRKANMETGSDWKITMDTNTLKNEEHNLSVRAYNGKTYSKIEFQKFEVSNLDSDGDGIPNILETSLLMDPFNKLDGTMDYDGDGFSNYEELVVENTDPFDGNKHPQRPEDKEDLVDNWALLFMISAIVCAFVIVGLFILNIKLERNIHKWREDLSSMRVERKPKTLLQKIVEIAPSFIGASMGGPALPGNVGVDQNAALPPAQEHEDTPPPQ
ncbi:MAG: Ig-like domain-containing protein, partial [Candidatus Thermoplasmatota archaeon]|nr:Ig-like domain-containing protein [Candidatus Thermoplasmatota archaeon]